jgi:hypothetical protein
VVNDPKATFTCRGCGAELSFRGAGGVLTPGGHETTRAYAIDPCPNCSKLQYGPLTEEMVAEALRSADFRNDVLTHHYANMARFVLRLLNALDECDIVPLGVRSRDWLLSLAREGE